MALNERTMNLLKKGMFDFETNYDEASYVVYNMVWHQMTKDQIVLQVMLRSNLDKEIIERLIEQKIYSLNKKCQNMAIGQPILTVDEYTQKLSFKAKGYLISKFAESNNLERDVRYVAFCCAINKIPIDIAKLIITIYLDFDRAKISLWTNYAYEDFDKKQVIEKDGWRQKFAKK